jgi:O-antigen ligase
MQALPASVPTAIRARSIARHGASSHRWLRRFLFVSVLSIAGSAFGWMRLGLGGLQMHPFMVPVGLLFGLVALPRLGLLPMRIRLTAFVFYAIYLLSMLQGGPGMVGEAVKVGAFFMTTIAIAVAVARSGGHVAVAVALSLSAAVMSVKGLVTGPQGLEGVNPIDLANKNAFSLYSLPALLVGGHLLLEQSTSARWVRPVVLACMLLTVVTIFSTANRSGWLGVLIIATMLFLRGQNLRTSVIVLLLAFVAYLLVVNFSATDVIEHRIDLTRGGYQSDRGRTELIQESVQIGLENPLLGVSPQQLPYDLARRMRVPGDAIDPHNLFGLIAGGCGLLGTLSLFALGWTMWTRSSPRRARALSPAARSAHALLRMALVLWIVRGMFSREVLYSPSFGVAIGLAIGLCVRADVWKRKPRRKVSA